MMEDTRGVIEESTLVPKTHEELREEAERCNFFQWETVPIPKSKEITGKLEFSRLFEAFEEKKASFL